MKIQEKKPETSGRKIDRVKVFALFIVMMLQGFGMIFVCLVVYYSIGDTSDTVNIGAAAVSILVCVAWYIGIALLAGRIPVKCKVCGARRKFSGWLVGCYRYTCDTCKDSFVVQFSDTNVSVEPD